MKALIVIVILVILVAILLLPYHPVSACPTATPTHTATPTATPSPTATQPPKLGPVQLYLPWVRSPALVVLVQPTATPTPGERVCSHPSDPTCKDD